MNTPNFTSLLTALRAFVLKSRPAYKDYLGTESVEEKTVLLTGTLSATGESVTAADGFTGFTNGQTYKATIGEETVEVTAQYGTGSFSECIVIGSSNAAPSDTVPGWMVCVYNGNLLGFGTGDWAGKQIEVATSKMVPTEKWDVKKLPKECLPEKMPENWAEELDVSDYNVIPVTVTKTDGEYTATSSYTYEEVKALVGERKNVVVDIIDGKSDYYASLVIDNGNYLLFSTYNAASKEMLILAWSEDAIQYLINPILTEDHLSNDEPLPAGTAAPGTSRLVSRADHVHPKEVEPITDAELEEMWDPPVALKFSSPEPFTLSVANTTKNWDGTLEYSTDAKTWTEWDGTTTLNSVNNKLYVRGTGNSKISDSSEKGWNLSGTAISCSGNIETLLDWQTVVRDEHPAMADSCYSSMFSDCTSLTTAPELPATTLADSCYRTMFSGCTSLTTAPELPATTLASQCYSYMFSDCTSLATAPELPATTLAGSCYRAMFSGCTSLTTAPELPATTLASQCYNYMFSDCTSLTIAPELPATTLTLNCYSSMFAGCTSLTTAPELPAITLKTDCYNHMFQNCQKIKLSATQTDEYTQAYRIPITGTGTTLSGSLTNMFIGTGGTFTGTPTINTTYYLHKDNSIVPAT